MGKLDNSKDIKIAVYDEKIVNKIAKKYSKLLYAIGKL